MTKTVVPVSKSVQDPCAGKGVLLSENLEAHFLSSFEESGDIVVRHAIQAAGVQGIGASSGASYLVVGQGHGTSLDRHGQRLVTAADFALIALATPGVEVHRVSVSTTLALTVQVDGTVLDSLVDSIVIDQGDC